MGIQYFSKLFDASQKEISLDVAIKNKKIGIDGFSEIYRAYLGFGKIAALTNHKGESTQHINVLLHNSIKQLKHAESIIWVFDTKASSLKKDEQDRRKQVKISAKEQIQECKDEIENLTKSLKETQKNDDLFINNNDNDNSIENAVNDEINKLKEKIIKLETRTYTIGQKMVNDCKFILQKLGIPWIDSPSGIEAEHLLGQMSQQSLIDVTITTDYDALVYGNVCILKKVSKKTGKYDMYKLSDCIDQHDLEDEEFIKVCVALGSDFNKKGIKGVGPKTVISKIKNNRITFNKEMESYIKEFQKEIEHIPQSTEFVRTNKSLDELSDWLIKDQGFKKEKIEKLLKPFYKS